MRAFRVLCSYMVVPEIDISAIEWFTATIECHSSSGAQGRNTVPPDADSRPSALSLAAATATRQCVQLNVHNSWHITNTSFRPYRLARFYFLAIIRRAWEWEKSEWASRTNFCCLSKLEKFQDIKVCCESHTKVECNKSARCSERHRQKLCNALSTPTAPRVKSVKTR